MMIVYLFTDCTVRTIQQMCRRVKLTRGQAMLMLLVICFFFVVVTTLVRSASASEQQPQATSYVYKLVTVKAGDSLWALAKRYENKADMDVHALMQAIREINRLDSPIVYAGENLLVPMKH